MAAFLARRVVSAVVLMFVLSVITFYLTRQLPGDPARNILGVTATPDQVALKRQELGLDTPLLSAYWSWLRDAIHGDFGTSWYSGQPVMQLIRDKLPVTISLALAATLLSGVLGTAVGMAAAVRGGVLDRMVQAASTLAFALPGFVVSVVLVLVFSVTLSWFPATGYSPFLASPGSWLQSVTLPVIALSIGATGAIAPQARSAALDVLGQDYVRTLRSRGLPRHRLYLRHVLRNSLPLVLTVLSLQFISLLGGAVIVESVFALPGLGSLATQASTQSDIPEIQGMVVVLVAVVVVINLVVDLCYGWLNPKVGRA